MPGKNSKQKSLSDYARERFTQEELTKAYHEVKSRSLQTYHFINGEQNRVIVAGIGGLAALPAYHFSFTFAHLSTVMKTKGAARINYLFPSLPATYDYLKKVEGSDFHRGRREFIKAGAYGSSAFFLGYHLSNLYWQDKLWSPYAGVLVGQFASSLFLASAEKSREMQQMMIGKDFWSSNLNAWNQNQHFRLQYVADSLQQKIMMDVGFFAYYWTESLSAALGLGIALKLQSKLDKEQGEKPGYQFLTNVTGFASAAILTSPLNVIATRYRATACNIMGQAYPSFWNCAKTTVNNEGKKVLMAGAKAQALHKGLQQGMLFTLFSCGYKKWQEYQKPVEARAVKPSSPTP